MGCLQLLAIVQHPDNVLCGATGRCHLPQLKDEVGQEWGPLVELI